MLSGREERREIRQSTSELNSNATKYLFSLFGDLRNGGMGEWVNGGIVEWRDDRLGVVSLDKSDGVSVHIDEALEAGQGVLLARLLVGELDRLVVQKVDVTQISKQEVLWVARLVLPVPKVVVRGEVVSSCECM